MSLKLLEPASIGKMSLKNRVVMMPMAFGGLGMLDRSLSQRVIEYYAARAEGGVGLIVTATFVVTATLVEGILSPTSTLPILDDKNKVSRLSELADELHQYGVKLCV